MKKFFMFMIATVVAFSAFSHSQDTKFFDNTYITVKGGATALTHPQKLGYEDWAHSIQGATSIQIGKWITPHWGFAIDGTNGWGNGSATEIDLDDYLYKQFCDWASGLPNRVRYVSVTALAKYRIPMGRFNLVAAAGPSWIHGFQHGMIENTCVTDNNDIGTKFQVEFNYDINKYFQINLVPEFNFNFTAESGKNQPRFNSVYSWYGLLAGVTFKINDGFKECNKFYTQEDVDALNDKINELQSRQPEVVTHIIEKVVPNLTNEFTLYFAKGSAEVTSREASKLNGITKGMKVCIIGKASPEGSAEFNQKLSEDRANAVAEILKARGVETEVKGVGASEGELSPRVAVVYVVE